MELPKTINMKKLILIICLLVSYGINAQERYLDPVFSSVSITGEVVYGINVTVITGAPALDTLTMDIYEPTGDTAAVRPLILYLHTGSFLPVPLNGQCTGDKSDSASVEMCMQLAKKGYVVASMNYRLGWNPVGDQDVRTGTLLNGVYRALQDAKSCVRYFRKTIATMSNPYKIDDTRIAIGGQGSGGYVALAYATVNSYDDINLVKFQNIGTGLSYIDTTLSGDWDGNGGVGLNQPMLNNPGYSNDVNFVFNMGGAMGDSSWMEAGDVPMVCFHVPNDPFAPYTYGPVIVPTTGQFVVNVSGSYDIERRATYLGNNDSFRFLGLTDAYTTRANLINDNIDGLFPLERLDPPGPLTGEAGPWEWWDTTCTNSGSSLLSNPDMSKVKGLAYIDTVQNYVCPRMFRALGLNVFINETLQLQKSVKVFPNPSTGNFKIAIDASVAELETIRITDIAGKVIRTIKGDNSFIYDINRQNLSPGIYFVKAQFTKGTIVKQVILD